MDLQKLDPKQTLQYKIVNVRKTNKFLEREESKTRKRIQ